jgi:pimeloyl-ACP methyl ester carboxylesterase
VPVAEGVSLAVDVWPGGGVPFVLVHGLASNARMWDGVASVLSGAECAVAAVDLRGHGRSDKPDDGYDFATVVADLVSVIRALGLERPVAVGQSWGGNVVVDLAARHPEVVGGVAGVDGGTIELWRHFPDWEACAEAKAPPPLAGRPLVKFEAAVRRMHPDWPESGIQGLLACFEVRADGTIAPWLTFDRHMQILRALWEHRPSELLPLLAVPVLLLPADSVPGGEHDLHAQHPEFVARRLLETFA